MTIASASPKAIGWRSRTTTRCWRIAPIPSSVCSPFIAGSRRVVLSGNVPADVGKDASRHPLLRRWDQRQGDPAAGGLTLGADNGALIPSSAAGQDGWLELEDGVEIQFVDPHNSVYRTGDYWLIPARVATGDVEWPSETVDTGQGNIVTQKVFLPPLGVVHHYAPLAVITVTDSNTISAVP